MKKKLALLLVATMAISLVGCGAKEDNGNDTKAPVENSSESTLESGDDGAGETTTGKPVETEAPIVKKVGTVDEATYNKAVNAFTNIVKQMRTDGIVKKSDVCVTVEGKNVKVDINYEDSDMDFILSEDVANKKYELILDYQCSWVKELYDEKDTAGQKRAPYNKELFKALLSMVTDEVEIVFNRIDSDCFSAFGLYNDKWTQIADCSLMGGRFELDKFFSYYITKEEVDTRDKTYTLTGTTADGKTVECIIEYDSSKVTYEQRQDYLTGEIEDYMHHPTDGEEGPYGYLSIGSGCKSFEEYKKMMIQKYKDLGDADPHFDNTYLVTHQVNGYTYYLTEFFYEYADAKGDPDVVYVQIGDNLYVEIFNYQCYARFEDFVIDSFFIKEVKVK